jgi:hypothetical protein
MWARNVARRNYRRRTEDMPLLVIEENMRAECPQNWRLGPNSHKVCFVGGSAPSSECVDDPSMRRCVSRCNDSYTDSTYTIAIHIGPS